MPFQQPINPAQVGTLPEFDPVLESMRSGPLPIAEWDEIFASAFRQENATLGLVGAGIAQWRDRVGESPPEDLLFEPHDLELNAGTVFEDHPQELNDIKTRQQWERKKHKLETEMHDRSILAQAGGRGIAASFVAAIFDPINFIPVGGTALFGGANLLRLAARTAFAGFAGASLAEAALHSTQELRTGTESFVGITAATLFGGVLGGAIALPPTLARNSVREWGAMMRGAAVEPEVRVGGMDPNAPQRTVVDGDPRTILDDTDFNVDEPYVTPTRTRPTKEATGVPC